MSGDCCGQTMNFDGLSKAYRRALLAVIAINGIMFVVEMSAGALAGSRALQADALDFFADTATYALSLFVIGKSLRLRASVALLKGVSLAVMGLWIFGSTAYDVFVLETPHAEVMGAIGFLALAANLGSVWLLLPHRDGDANVRSVWLCSRNDAIGNLAVMAAALGVWISGTAWPDLIVAGLMAGLFSWSAFHILRQAWGEMRHLREPEAAAGE
ncbi:MAG: cation transporter [Limibacillus sp.]|jgi:Co/Zn/Cd efflux system component